jgi:hypothetical protein
VCDSTYVIDDQVFIFGPNMPDGPMYVVKEVSLPFSHPDAYELEVQIAGAPDVVLVQLYSQSTADPSKVIIIATNPGTALGGSSPPVRRLLKGMRQLWLEATGPATGASVHVRLWGRRR